MEFKNQLAFSKKPTDLPDKPSPNYSPSDIKSYFETPSDELKDTLNALIDDLNTDGWVDSSKIAENGVERSNLKPGSVGVDQLDPELFKEPTTAQGVQAKFLEIDQDKPNYSSDNVNNILIAPFFRSNSDTNVYLYLSSDGINFKKLSDSAMYSGRDSSIMYQDGYFYIAYTGYNPHDFMVLKTKNFKEFDPYPISVGLFIDNGFNDKIWAPEWFEDETNGKVYIIISRKVGTETDINNATIDDFRPYLVECTDLENLTFGTPVALNLENINKIDGFIYQQDMLYHLFIKDEHDKKIEHWTSSNLVNWSKLSDDLIGSNYEAPCLTYYEGTYYLYTDHFTEGFFYVSTSTDLTTFTTPVPINIKDVNRHGTILNLSDRDAKMIITDYILSNDVQDRSFAKTIDLGTLATSGAITELQPRESILYTSGAANGDIVINAVTNPYGIKCFYVTLRSDSTGSIRFKKSTNLEVSASTDLVISANLGNSDAIYEFEWIEDLSIFKPKNTNPSNFLTNPAILDGGSQINLNTIGTSGSNLTNFTPKNGQLYTVTGSDIFTISGISSMPDGTRFFIGLFTSSTSASLTLKSGNNLTVPGGTVTIDVTGGRNDMIYELIKMNGTTFRLMGFK